MPRSFNWATLALWLAAPCVNAAVALPQTTQMLTHQATSVVRGIVEGQRVGYDEAVHHATVETTLRIEEALKGAGPSKLVIRQLKGIPGDARFTRGEEVVVFVRAGAGAAPGVSFLLGMAQGKFAVKRTLQGDGVVERNFTDLHLLKPGAVEKITTLADLRAKVKAAVAADERSGR